LTIRGGGNRQQTWHRCRRREWARRPGASPPMRMTASWSGSERTYRIQVCGARCAPWRAPLGSSRRHLTSAIRRRSFEERPTRCSSSLRVLRRQGAAKHKRRSGGTPPSSLAFRSLDPFRALREPDRRRRDEERPFPLRTKNCEQNPKQPLDRKSPVQVSCEPDFLDQGPLRLADP